MNLERNQYTNQIVGNLTKARLRCCNPRRSCRPQGGSSRSEAAQAQSEAAQAKTLEVANEQEAAATKATLNQVQGQLAQEVAQAAIARGAAGSGRGGRGASAAAKQAAAAAAARATTVAGAVGGSSSGAAARRRPTKPEARWGQWADPRQGGGGGHGHGARRRVPAGSALRLRRRAGGGRLRLLRTRAVGLAPGRRLHPRTTETEWPALPHVSLNALQPGDLLFYYNLDSDNQVDHVVMYTGAGPYGTSTVIEAPFTGSTVVLAHLHPGPHRGCPSVAP